MQDLNSIQQDIVALIAAWWIILVVLYFVPTVIVMFRRPRNSAGIILLNIFGGWTGVGWLMALLWSVWVDKELFYGSDAERLHLTPEERSYRDSLKTAQT